MAYGWDDSERSYQASREYNGEPHHKAKFGHEVLAGAASFGAFKLFEDRQRREGKPVSHAFAKELLVGIAGAEIDKIIESKGLDYIDRRKAKMHAQENIENMYDQHYVRGHGADQYDPSQYGPPQHLERHEHHHHHERRDYDDDY
ncbi:hypothetical protein BKA65DRAFT_480674 [Rhexocercosporidium sp. MPI-PUGE-AT-0058]|nr:hypothetical protein BKA65DRAFT_480674 [Rhexocercosporidium sp. MPI-PUGE-AT-0058]